MCECIILIIWIEPWFWAIKYYSMLINIHTLFLVFSITFACIFMFLCDVQYLCVHLCRLKDRWQFEWIRSFFFFPACGFHGSRSGMVAHVYICWDISSGSLIVLFFLQPYPLLGFSNSYKKKELFQEFYTTWASSKCLYHIRLIRESVTRCISPSLHCQFKKCYHLCCQSWDTCFSF